MRGENDNRTLDTALASVIKKVEFNYGEEIALAIRSGLAVVACHSLEEREHCISLIYVGPSGTGKSVAVNVFMPDRTKTKAFLHRVDNFTPASFVSHAANKKRSQLESIDLLPKIKNKTMLTKELSPLFRGDPKEMQKSFAVLTSVLDGKGYVSESGAQGERGYTGEHLFNWIGATTPFSDHVYKLMAQLGNRMYFYEILSVDLKEDDLIEFAKRNNGDTALKDCQKAVNDFIESHFQRYPMKSVDPSSITIPGDVLKEIVRYSQLISVGRVEVTRDDYLEHRSATPEGPHRIILSLKMLIMGSALAGQRTAVTAKDDLPMVCHIAFSTIPETRRRLLQALLLRGGTLTSTDAATALRTSRPTAHNWMKELAVTGIVQLQPGGSQNSVPTTITLADDWSWLLGDESHRCNRRPTGTDPL